MGRLRLARPALTITIGIGIALGIALLGHGHGGGGGGGGVGASARADEISLRGEPAPTVGFVLDVDAGGVEFQESGRDPRVYSWDRVRAITAESEMHQTAFEEHRSLAEDLWRARSRVEREDYALAEPIFERYADRMRARTDPTAYVVMEGLLRCRLARGARAAAVIPWLEIFRQRAEAQRGGPLDEDGFTEAYAALDPVIDERTGLCPALAPVWIEGPDLESLVNDFDGYVGGAEATTKALTALYRYAARRAVGRTPAPEPMMDPAGGESNGNPNPTAAVSLVRACVAAMYAPMETATDRDGAMKGLSQWARRNDWAGAWSHYARGIARLRAAGENGDEEDRRRGLVDLLHLPSEYVEIDPFLAGLALVRAAAALEDAGRTDAADSLRLEFETRFADHPAHRRRPPGDLSRVDRPDPMDGDDGRAGNADPISESS